MSKNEQVDHRVRVLVARLHSWLPQDAADELISVLRTGDTNATFTCLCRHLNQTGIYIQRTHYREVARLADDFTMPSACYQNLHVYASA